MKSYLLIKGFALLELLAVIAIIGTLSAVGIPMYQDYMIRVIEKQAVNNLQSIAFSQSEYVRDQNAYFSGSTEDIDKQFFAGKEKLSQGKYQYESNGDEKSYIASACIKNSNSEALSFNINQDKVINLNKSCVSKSTEAKAVSEKKEESPVFSDCTDPYAWGTPYACVVYLADTGGKGVTKIIFGRAVMTKGVYRLMEEYLEGGYKDKARLYPPKGGPVTLDVDYYFTPRGTVFKYPDDLRFPDKFCRGKRDKC
jgi:prepilin-type N-terminal cleavage/methylation domain-containing protein